MFFEFKDIILKLDMKKHYEDEPENSKILYISMKIEVSDDLLLAKKLEDTFDYADYEMKLFEVFNGKKFELIEEVACLIFEFTNKYSDNIFSCDLSIKKKDILRNTKSIVMNVFKRFKDF